MPEINLEESRQRQIKELEKALKNPNQGCAECREIAKQSLEILKQKHLINLTKNFGREL